jgi:hypothetical protein
VHWRLEGYVVARCTLCDLLVSLFTRQIFQFQYRYDNSMLFGTPLSTVIHLVAPIGRYVYEGSMRRSVYQVLQLLSYFTEPYLDRSNDMSALRLACSCVNNQ